MINLIPNQEKKRKIKDFYFRLGVVCIAALGACVLIATLAIMPSYFLSSVEKNLSYKKLSAQKAEPVPSIDQDSLRVMEELDRKLGIIERAEESQYPVSKKIIQEIMLKKMPDVKIIRLSYEGMLPGKKEIQVYGIAPSRERLLVFRRALEDDVAFEKVELPISNFIKGSNIEFYLKLIPRPEGGRP